MSIVWTMDIILRATFLGSEIQNLGSQRNRERKRFFLREEVQLNSPRKSFRKNPRKSVTFIKYNNSKHILVPVPYIFSILF